MHRSLARRLSAFTIGLTAAAFAGLGAAPVGANAGPVLSPPSTMAATGDSFTRGYATNGPGCTTPTSCPQYSWATGTAVNSHYQRLLGLNAALTATNAAQLGASSGGLVSQMATIASLHPDYVTVLIGASDVCFFPVSTTQFQTNIHTALNTLFAASPSSHVLVGSIWNLESFRTAVLAANPSFHWSFCSNFFEATPSIRAGYMARLQAYNQALATECAAFANCLFDGYALYNHAWTASEVSLIDGVHPSVAGEEMIAQVEWDAGYTWALQPPDKDACKDDGWHAYVDASGAPFTNQGDCVSYVATGGRNPA